MSQLANRGSARQKRHARIRLNLEGSGSRPRLAVFRSLNHIYAQVIDDASGKTLAAASTVEKELRGAKQTKTDEARVVGRLVATHHVGQQGRAGDHHDGRQGRGGRTNGPHSPAVDQRQPDPDEVERHRGPLP